MSRPDRERPLTYPAFVAVPIPVRSLRAVRDVLTADWRYFDDERTCLLRGLAGVTAETFARDGGVEIQIGVGGSRWYGSIEEIEQAAERVVGRLLDLEDSAAAIEACIAAAGTDADSGRIWSEAL